MASGRGGPRLRAADLDRIWEVLKAFASFGFCKAHAAAFALPTYQSAWLKAHHPAAFLAGVLTHDPGMYPKRLILDDARSLGITVLGLDVNASGGTYRVERHRHRRGLARWTAARDAVRRARTRPTPPMPGRDRCPRGRRSLQAVPGGALLEPWVQRAPAHPDLPDGRDYGIRLSLADVKGISDAEVERIVAGQPYATLADFWHRAHVSRPVVERLVIAGGFDSLYGLGGAQGPAAATGSAGAGGSPGATCCCTSSSSTGGPGRSPARVVGWPRAPAGPTPPRPRVPPR